MVNAINQKIQDLRNLRVTHIEQATSNVCPVCGGCGYIMEYRGVPEIYGYDEFERPKEALFAISCHQCRGNLEARANRSMDLSGIPLDYKDRFRNDFHWDLYASDVGKQELLINHFLDHFSEWEVNGKGLYIFSKCKGSGKTFLSSILGNELMTLYGLRVKFVVVSDLLNKIKQADKELTVNPIATYSNTDVLILDDLGSVNGNNWLDDSLFQILDKRMHSGRVTVITSNLPFDKLPHDERVINRIYKCCIPLHLPDISIRSHQAEEENISFLKGVGIL